MDADAPRGLLRYFDDLDDPRRLGGNHRYRLSDTPNSSGGKKKNPIHTRSPTTPLNHVQLVMIRVR